MTKIKNAATKVAQGLEEALRTIPGWISTVDIIEKIFKLVDLAIVVFLTSAEETAKAFYENLAKIAGAAPQEIKSVVLPFLALFLHSDIILNSTVRWEI
jgi:hypothetical protein